MLTKLGNLLLLSSLCIGLAVSHETWPDSASLARDTAPPGVQEYSFDIDAGAELQSETSKEPATALEFTTEAGVPYSQPYDYQRIGSDGEYSSSQKSVWLTAA